MPEFGDALRNLRRRHGLKQQDLAEALGTELSRSTIANVEVGRQQPSVYLWALLVKHFPGEEARLRPIYERARTQLEQAAVVRKRQSLPRAKRPTTLRADASDYQLGGPFVIERLDIVYVFRESHSPEEIIEIRRVRALQRTQGYRLKIGNNETADYRLEPEVLWGGQLVHEERHAGSSTVYLRQFEFDRPLRRGDVHQFGIRHWIEKDPEPGDSVLITMTLRTDAVGLHLNFLGSQRPGESWRFGPVADADMTPGTATPKNKLNTNSHGCVSTEFVKPEIGTYFGIGWKKWCRYSG